MQFKVIFLSEGNMYSTPIVINKCPSRHSHNPLWSQFTVYDSILFLKNKVKQKDKVHWMFQLNIYMYEHTRP